LSPGYCHGKQASRSNHDRAYYLLADFRRGIRTRFGTRDVANDGCERGSPPQVLCPSASRVLLHPRARSDTGGMPPWTILVPPTFTRGDDQSSLFASYLYLLRPDWKFAQHRLTQPPTNSGHVAPGRNTRYQDPAQLSGHCPSQERWTILPNGNKGTESRGEKLFRGQSSAIRGRGGLPTSPVAYHVLRFTSLDHRRSCPGSLLTPGFVTSEIPSTDREVPAAPSLSSVWRSSARIVFRIAFSSAVVPGAVSHRAHRISSAVMAYSKQASNLFGSGSARASAQASRQDCCGYIIREPLFTDE
jgi:hypothetical protein